MPGQPVTATAPPLTHRLQIVLLPLPPTRPTRTQMKPALADAMTTEADCITTMKEQCTIVGGTMQDSACKSGGAMCKGTMSGMTGNACTNDASCPVVEKETPLCCDYWAKLFKDACSGADSAKVDAQVRIETACSSCLVCTS